MADRSRKWRRVLTVAVASSAISVATQASSNQSISSSASFSPTSSLMTAQVLARANSGVLRSANTESGAVSSQNDRKDLDRGSSRSGGHDKKQGDKRESTPLFTEHRSDLEHLTGRKSGGDGHEDESDGRGGSGDDKDKGGGGNHGGGGNDGDGGNHGGGNNGGGPPPNPSPTPEPSTILLLATGMAWAAGAIRRRPGK